MIFHTIHQPPSPDTHTTSCPHHSHPLSFPCRLPRSLLAGLMWFDPDRPETVYKGEVRHAASQGDGLTSYGWLRHDGVRYGVQQLLDREYNITLSLVGAGVEQGWLQAVPRHCEMHVLLCMCWEEGWPVLELQPEHCLGQLRAFCK